MIERSILDQKLMFLVLKGTLQKCDYLNGCYNVNSKTTSPHRTELGSIGLGCFVVQLYRHTSIENRRLSKI